MTTHVKVTAALHDDKNWCVKVYTEDQMPDGRWVRSPNDYEVSTLTTSSPSMEKSIWDNRRFVIEEIKIVHDEAAKPTE